MSYDTRYNTYLMTAGALRKVGGLDAHDSYEQAAAAGFVRYPDVDVLAVRRYLSNDLLLFRRVVAPTVERIESI